MNQYGNNSIDADKRSQNSEGENQGCLKENSILGNLIDTGRENQIYQTPGYKSFLDIMKEKGGVNGVENTANVTSVTTPNGQNNFNSIFGNNVIYSPTKQNLFKDESI